MNLQGRILTYCPNCPISGADVHLLHEELRKLGYAIPDDEWDQFIYGQGTYEAVLKFQQDHRNGRPNAYDELLVCGEVGCRTAQAINVEVDSLPPSVSYTVTGTVWSPDRADVSELHVKIVDKNIEADEPMGEDAVTDDHGHYTVYFDSTKLRQRGKDHPDLQARVFDPTGQTFLAASEIRYNASQVETLNVELPANSTSLASEHEALTRAIALHYKGHLADLQESDGRQDITYLANKTGWDARAVALAALADQFSTRTADAAGTPAIPQAFFYALFLRPGLLANEDTLYHTDAGTLEAVWKKAVEQGVIPKASVDQIPNLIGRFQAVSAQKMLTGPVLVGASSVADMLTVSRLNPDQQARFAQLYAVNRTDMPAFWKAVGEDETFGGTPDERSKSVKRLQVDGKLGFLTINNAPLMQALHAKAGDNGITDLVQLAQKGYHRAEAWSPLLSEDVPIPKEILDDPPGTRRANYAVYLAAQVRLSYPTASVAQMLRSDDPNSRLQFAGQDFSDEVHQFLSDHQNEFVIGVQPVEQYLAQKRGSVKITDEARKQVNQLERVHQITPSDQAMSGLMKRGIDAAYHVVGYERDTFIKSFAADLGGEDHAALTYDKSVQVHNTVVNIVLSYLTARNLPAIGVHSPSGVLDPVPANPGDVIAYANMESLFGSMDFCACEHCRSLLSPAAYLVDLLLLLKSDPKVWDGFLKGWHHDHPNLPYPFTDQNKWQEWQSQHPGQSYTEDSPFEVLTSRRPDIENLPLTCENTNTAMPYIDVVNETLEYYVANQLSLDGYQGNDTNGTAEEDLLASPQFVTETAYTVLNGACFPAPLPFHKPLENLRRYFNKFEVPLPLAMERLRKTDDLERGTNPYGWRDILMEALGLSRAEYEILTDFTAVPLWRMYGFPKDTTDTDVIAGLFNPDGSPKVPGLSNAKQFSRRMGIPYEDLVSLLKTRFINPYSDLIPKLEPLGVSFATLKGLKDGTITDSDFDKLLAALAVPPDPARYGGDPNAPKQDYAPIRTWVKNNENYARIMGLITLAIPAVPWVAGQYHRKGDCVLRPAPAVPDSALYYECTTPGQSGTSEPNWATSPGDPPFTDGTACWTCREATSPDSFGNLAFRYSDPARITENLGAAAFVRLLRFIRLWKKLGWTIEQTDAAICALYPLPAPPPPRTFADETVPNLDAGFKLLLPRLGIMVRVMKALGLTVKRNLLPLLACWSDIGTHGDAALYRRMFLNPAVLSQDPVFGDKDGEFLTDKNVRLADHAEALRSAFNLTGKEYDAIVAALRDDAKLHYDTNTPLTVQTISEIFRRGWLARKLKISVLELLRLVQFTGLDPFAVPNDEPTLTNPALLRLISLVQALKQRSLKPAAALYLIWNQDLSGRSAPDPAQVAALARTLRLGFAAVESEFAVADDPDGAITRADGLGLRQRRCRLLL